MPRSSPFWTALLSLGTLASAAWADDPPCPTQTGATPPGTAPTSAPGATTKPGATAPDTAAPANAAPGTPTSGQPANATPGSPARAGERPAGQSATPGLNPKVDKPGRIEIEADQGTLAVNGNEKLKGNVVARQGDREIKADQLEYNSASGAIHTEGGIDYTDPIVHVTGNGGDYSPTKGADFKAAQFELRQRAARGSAQSMKLTPEGVIRMEGVTFSTCPRTDNSWQLDAGSITLDSRTKVGSGRDARIDFKGVPIMYLPWVSFPLGTERKSGFLFPTIGNTSSSGAWFSVPYYWNIAPNADFTFQPAEYYKRGLDAGGEFRFLTQTQHGDLNWNYLPYDDSFHGSRGRVKLTDVADLTSDLRFSVNAESVSDNHYFEEFAPGPEGTSTAFLDRHALFSYRGEHWRFDGEAQQFQTIDTLDVNPNTGVRDIDRPYASVPRLALSADYGWGPHQLLRYGLDSEVVNFERTVGVTGWRIDLMPTASLNLDGPGYFMHPSIAWRATQYELANTLPGEDRTPSRTLPIASFDTGLLFDRPAGSRGQRTVTLEPRLLYLYVPYRNQDTIPIFDTALPDLNPVDLYRTNRYVGADRVSDANQVSLGVTSRLLDANNGRQFLAATFGQIYYFQEPQVRLKRSPLNGFPTVAPNGAMLENQLVSAVPDEPASIGKRSDFVAQLALTAFQDWGADIGIQWDPQTSNSQRTVVNVQYKPANDQIINVGYRYERFTLDQAEISGVWPISRTWRTFAREVYSIRDHKGLESFAGFEYRSCCWGVRFGGRRYVSTFTGSQNTSVVLELELTGLASVGPGSNAFLSENIRGYVPADANAQKVMGR